MNDFTTLYLVRDRQATLRAEADRERLSRSVPRHQPVFVLDLLARVARRFRVPGPVSASGRVGPDGAMSTPGAD